jgi:glycosyltransferase involved in cell wall biosynthesis
VGLGVRLTYVSRRAWPSRGGTERYLSLFATVLAGDHGVQVLAQQVDDAQRGHLAVAYLGARFRPTVAEGVRVDPLRLSLAEKLRLLPLVGRAAAYRVPRLRLADDDFKRYGAVLGSAIARTADAPDVLHVMTGGNLAAAGAYAKRVMGVPLVVTPQAHPGQWDDDPASGVAYRQAELIVASGEADANTYRALGVVEERLAIVPPCTARLPAGTGDTLRREHGIDGSMVLFLGVRRPYKGHDVLLQAAPRIIREVPRTTFAFVGPGPRLAPPPDGVRVLDVGPVSEQDKAAWLDAADVVALPSAYESFGLVVAEAWSVGTPVVASRVPALAELVAAGRGGLVVDRVPSAVAAAVIELLQDSGAARAMGEAGRRYWAANHTPERTADRLLELYRGL